MGATTHSTKVMIQSKAVGKGLPTYKKPSQSKAVGKGLPTYKGELHSSRKIRLNILNILQPNSHPNQTIRNPRFQFLLSR